MGLFRRLKEEIDVVFQRDPAARSVLEVPFLLSWLSRHRRPPLSPLLYRHKLYFLARPVLSN